jgi:thymidylate synthase
MSNWIETQYFHLLEDILEQGVKKTDRTGTGTISLFGRQIRHNMKDGFPLLTTKKMAFKTMVTELLWFLRGDTNIKYLVDNDCNIWNGDAYKRFSQIRKSMLMLKPPASEDKLREYIEWYEQVTTQEEFINKIKTDDEFAKKWGELGPIYGKQWRGWKKNDSFIVEDDVWKNNEGWCSLKDFNKDELYIDQIQNSINLLKTDPDSRRNRVNAWNVGELDQMVLPPCHTDFQFFTRELSDKERIEWMGGKIQEKYPALVEQQIKHCDEHNVPKRAISLMWNQRSVDTFLGLPFNIASYGLLLEIIAKAVNMIPDELIGNLGDVHLYSNHIEQAKEQLTRKPYKLPTLRHLKTDEFYKSLGGDLSLITHLDNTDFIIENYQSHPAIKAPLSN